MPHRAERLRLAHLPPSTRPLPLLPRISPLRRTELALPQHRLRPLQPLPPPPPPSPWRRLWRRRPSPTLQAASVASTPARAPNRHRVARPPAAVGLPFSAGASAGALPLARDPARAFLRPHPALPLPAGIGTKTPGWKEIMRMTWKYFPMHAPTALTFACRPAPVSLRLPRTPFRTPPLGVRRYLPARAPGGHPRKPRPSASSGPLAKCPSRAWPAFVPRLPKSYRPSPSTPWPSCSMRAASRKSPAHERHMMTLKPLNS
jgi:hypothetical protein